MNTLAPNGMRPVDRGVEDGIAWATCKAPIFGAINGYARVPEDHPWHELDYDEIDVDVHGGLTYSAFGWIGFDTIHLGDFCPGMDRMLTGYVDIEWTSGMVAREARSLARQVAAAGRGEPA